MCVATLSKNQRSCEMTKVLPAKFRIASSRHLPGQNQAWNVCCISEIGKQQVTSSTTPWWWLQMQDQGMVQQIPPFDCTYCLRCGLLPNQPT